VASEQDWELDKQRFIDDARLSERQGLRPVRDHGSRLGPLAQQFATLTYSLLDARTIEDVLSQVVDAATWVIPEADLVSVTVRAPDGRYHTPAYSDELAVRLDTAQYEAGEGPCLCAAVPDGPALAECPDLALDTRWPNYAPRAVALGVRSVLALTLPMPKGRLAGALNLFCRTPHGLDTVDRGMALLLATHASLALAATDAVTEAQLREVDLKRAIDSRDVIGQAKGIIMARKGVDAADAFDILRKASMDLNIKLVKLAESVATRHGELDLTSS
jgi:GAF domain-containing protein